MILTSTDKLSNYTAEWRSRGDRVMFILTGAGQGWVGIGFSHDRMMVTIFCFPLFVKNFIID